MLATKTWDEILKPLPLSNLSALRRTSTFFDDLVREILDRRFTRALRPFVVNVRGFKDLLKNTDGALSGGLPLWFHNSKVNSLPSRLDIVVPEHGAPPWIDFLHHNGYVTLHPIYIPMHKY